MHCKSYSHFFSKKFQHICASLDVNFNESLTNDVVSFEQLGPDIHRVTRRYIVFVFSLCVSVCLSVIFFFLSNISLELLHLGSRNLVQMSCLTHGIVGKGTCLLLLVLPFICPYFFLSCQNYGRLPQSF